METLNKKRNYIFNYIIVVLLCFFYLSIITVSAFADEETQLFKVLQECEINSTSDLFISFFRLAGFGILKLLGSAADSCYEGLTSIYTALDFTHSTELLALNARYSMLYKMVFMIAVAMLGLYLIGRNTQNQLNTTTCIMLMVVIILGMPIFTEKLADLTKVSTTYAQEQWADNAEGLNLDSISGSIVDDYIIDLSKVDGSISENNIGQLKDAVNKRTGYNNIDENTNDWRYIGINDVMDYNEESYTYSWEEKIEKGESGYEMTKLSTWVPFMDTYYYRYQLSSWIEPILMLLILSGVLILTGFRCALFICAIAMAEVYAPFIAATDIASGQRIKEMIKHFLTLFGCIFLCVALLGIYFVGYKWINVHISMVLPKLILQCAFAYKVIDGPNLIERILGVDIGVREGWKTLLGAKMAADTVGDVGRKAGRMATSPARAAKAGVNAKNKAKDGIDAMKEKKATADSEAAKWQRSGTDPMSQKNPEGNDTQTSAGEKQGNANDPMKDRADNKASAGADHNTAGTDPMKYKPGNAAEHSGVNDNMRQRPANMPQQTTNPQPEINNGKAAADKNLKTKPDAGVREMRREKKNV